MDYASVWPGVPIKTYTPESFAAECLSSMKLGNRLLSTQHLLGVPYIESATPEEIVVQWQQIASHGRRFDNDKDSGRGSDIAEQCNARSFLQHTFSKIDGNWKISHIKPTVLFSPDISRVFRPEGE